MKKITLCLLIFMLLFSWSCKERTESKKDKKKKLPVKFEKYETELGDAKQDTLDKNNKKSTKYPYVDLVRIKINLEKENIHITFETTADIPQKTNSQNSEIEYQLLIDETKDTQADYQVSVTINNEGAIPKIQNIDLQTVKIGEKFPGLYKIEKNKAEIWVNTDQFKSPELFDWIAFTIIENRTIEGDISLEKDLSPDAALEDVAAWNTFPLE